MTMVSTLPVAAVGSSNGSAAKSGGEAPDGASGDGFAELLGVLAGAPVAAPALGNGAHGPARPDTPPHDNHDEHETAAGVDLGATALLLAAAASLSGNAAATAHPAGGAATATAAAGSDATVAAVAAVVAPAGGTALDAHAPLHTTTGLPAAASPTASPTGAAHAAAGATPIEGRPEAAETARTARPVPSAYPQPTGENQAPGQAIAAAAHTDPSTVRGLARSPHGETADPPQVDTSAVAGAPSAGSPAPGVPSPRANAAAQSGPPSARTDATATSDSTADTSVLAQAMTANPSQPAQPTTQPAPAAVPSPMTVPVPQPELAQAFASLRNRPDGTHELSVQLHPVELGAVQVTATISNGQLTVTLACAHQVARDAVAAALPALQQQLQGANFGGVDLGFSAFAQQQGGQPAPQSQSGPPTANPERVLVEPAPAARATPQRRVPSESGLDRLL